jgi:hypothetical protein
MCSFQNNDRKTLKRRFLLGVKLGFQLSVRLLIKGVSERVCKELFTSNRQKVAAEWRHFHKDELLNL